MYFTWRGMVSCSVILYLIFFLEFCLRIVGQDKFKVLVERYLTVNKGPFIFYCIFLCKIFVWTCLRMAKVLGLIANPPNLYWYWQSGTEARTALTLSTTNPKWTAPGMNQGFRGDIPQLTSNRRLNESLSWRKKSSLAPVIRDLPIVQLFPIVTELSGLYWTNRSQSYIYSDGI